MAIKVCELITMNRHSLQVVKSEYGTYQWHFLLVDNTCSSSIYQQSDICLGHGRSYKEALQDARKRMSAVTKLVDLAYTDFMLDDVKLSYKKVF